MKKLVLFSAKVLMFLLLTKTIWAQSSYSQSEVRNMTWEQDSFCYVNPKYYYDNPQYDLTLNIAYQPDKKVRVMCGDEEWGRFVDGTNWTFRHFFQRGLFKLAFLRYDKNVDIDGGAPALDTVYKWVLNRELDMGFNLDYIYDGQKNGCLTEGADTFLIALRNPDPFLTGRPAIEANPPHTGYFLKVESGMPFLNEGPVASEYLLSLEGGGEGSPEWISAQWLNPLAQDSIRLIVKEPTGLHGVKISIKMMLQTEDKEGNGLTLENTTTQIEELFVFDKPDIREIFRKSLEDVFPDTDTANFLVCAPNGPDGNFSLNNEWLRKYSHKGTYGKEVPHQLSREGFEVRFWYTDSITNLTSPQSPQYVDPSFSSHWREVTEDREYVDDSVFYFKKPGFYKVRVEMWNKCNVEPEEHDTLWTTEIYTTPYDPFADDPRVPRDDRWRYFQVFENQLANLVCPDSSVLCRNRQDTITFIDRNRRMWYDPLPEYAFEVTDTSGVVLGADYYYSTVADPLIYKGDRILHVSDPNVESEGCDSTVIKLAFLKPGHFKIKWSRTPPAPAACAEEDPGKMFEFHVGDVPQIVSDTVRSDLFKKVGGFMIAAHELNRCDSFTYQLPDFRAAFRDNNMALDSVGFWFTKGDSDSAMVFTAGQDLTDRYFVFDSVGNKLNYIRLRISNACGWSKADSVRFYTRTLPRVEILRDSMTDNDTLCVGFGYSYTLGGQLPEHYTDSVCFSRRTQIDDIEIEGSEGNAYNADFHTILHPEAGETVEYYRVTNTDYPICKSEFKDTVVIIDSPSVPLYRDSVLFCNSLDTLDVSRLFGQNPVFRTAEWKWNRESTVEMKFPEFELTRTANDTLAYKVAASKGCFIEDTLVFIPRVTPRAGLALDMQIRCAPDTIKGTHLISFWQSQGGNLSANGIHWNVYRNSILADSLLYDSKVIASQKDLPLTGTTQDSLYLIYEMKNEAVDTAFRGPDECRLNDTLALRVFKPLLKVNRRDTLAVDGTYDFSRLQDDLDTSDLAGAVTWAKVPDNGSSDHLLTESYPQNVADQSVDSLLFVLKAATPCGDILRDTLVLFVPHARISGYTDTVCSTTVDYALWGNVHSEFIDTATLRWNLIEVPAGRDWGELKPNDGSDKTVAQGSSATYTPGADVTQNDTVKIQVKGTGINGGNVWDTIFIRVNPKPEITISGWDPATDTLLFTDDQRLNIGKIKGLVYTHVHSYRAEVTNGRGEPDGDTVVMSTLTNTATDNSIVEFKIIAQGLSGCGTVSKDFKAMDLCNPAYKSKYTPLVLCPAETIDMDTVIRFTSGKDKYTYMKWNARNGTGSLAEGHVYTAGTNLEVVQMDLFVYKSYVAYTGDTIKEMRGGGSVTIDMNVHTKPQFILGKSDSTICAGTESIEITKGQAVPGSHDWVRVYPGVYVDSLRFNGQALGDGMYTFRKGDGETDTVRVTVDQGKCHLGDTSLYLHRLEKAVKGTIPDMEVCENGQLTVDVSGLDTTSSMKSYVWSCDGNATLNSPTVFAPEYSPKGYGSGTGKVTIYASSVKEYCGTDSVSGKVTVYRLPEIKLKDDTVCKVLPSYAAIRVEVKNSVGSSGIAKVEWLNKSAGGDKFGESQNPDWSVQYPLGTEDTARGYVEIVAVVYPKDVCTASEVRDTMRLTLQNPPVYVPKTNPWICEGGGILLTDLAEITHDAGSVWTPAKGTVSDGKYFPGDNNGTVQFNIQIRGLHGCPSLSPNLNVTVNKAPQPDFAINGNACEAATTTFGAISVPGTTVDKYRWEIEGQRDSAGNTVSHVFTADGIYPVKLTEVYTYGGVKTCERSHTKEFTIHPKPVAEFTYSPQVPANVDITFTNQSEPAGILTTGNFKWTVEGDPRNWTTPDLSNYRFPLAVYEGVDVTLYAETEHGCKDTVTHKIVIVELPAADFEVEMDSCTGKAVFTLDSTGLNGSKVYWDFGKNEGTVEGAAPDTVYYQRFDKDTVYHVTLRLENAAGSSVMEKDLKLISTLQARFTILPEDEGCYQIKRKMAIEIQGHSDKTSMDWGDGSGITEFDGNTVKQLTHRFDNESLYPVVYTLRLSAENKCTETPLIFEDSIKVLPSQVTVEFGMPEGASICFGTDSLKVENQSIGFDPVSSEWGWRFGEDNALTNFGEETTKHVFEHPGTYKVMLWMRDRCNEDTVSHVVEIKGNDSLYFDILQRPYCTGENITMRFIQKGSPVFGDLKWTLYGPGEYKSFSNMTEVNHSFRNPGTYNVLLQAKADGCVDEQTLSFRVNKTPEAIINLPHNVDTGCEPFEVGFRAVDGSGVATRVLWDFKNGVASSETRETVKFLSEGTYDVTLTLTSDSGCVNTDHKMITVLHTPRIGFSVNDSLFCTRDGNFEVVTTNTSEDLEACRFEWFKTVGNGATESIANTPQIAPLSFVGVTGPVAIELKATHLQSRCSAEFTQTVIASEEVKAQVYKDAAFVCLDNPVYFASRSENATQAKWEMGDGTVSTDTAFEYVYDHTGEYALKLTVRNDDGCQDSLLLPLTVYPLPTADFEAFKDNSVIGDYPDSLNLPKLNNGGVRFENHSFVAEDRWGTELHYRWDFGDTTEINTAKDPLHRFVNNGLYTVKLEVSTAYQCVDSLSRMVQIDAIKGLYVPTAFAPATADEGMNRFQPKGIGLHLYKVQIFDPWSGTCVWSSDRLKDGQPAEYWDGKFNGADLPKGNYIWKISAVFIDGSVWQNENGKTEGSVILIR